MYQFGYHLYPVISMIHLYLFGSLLFLSILIDQFKCSGKNLISLLEYIEYESILKSSKPNYRVIHPSLKSTDDFVIREQRLSPLDLSWHFGESINPWNGSEKYITDIIFNVTPLISKWFYNHVQINKIISPRGLLPRCPIEATFNHIQSIRFYYDVYILGVLI